MNLAELSIKRPVFITCLVALMIILGLISYKKMPVDQFPDVTFPIVFVEVLYPGASPVDVERQISKILEDEVSSLPGLESVSSYNYDSVGTLVIKFKLYLLYCLSDICVVNNCFFYKILWNLQIYNSCRNFI